MAEAQIFSNASADAAIATLRYQSGDRRSRAGRYRLSARRFSDDHACDLTTLQFEQSVQASALDRLRNQIQQLRLGSLSLPVRSRLVRFRKSPMKGSAVVHPPNRLPAAAQRANSRDDPRDLIRAR